MPGRHRHGGGPAPLSLFSHLRWDVAIRHVTRVGPKTILEFGCGVGGFGSRFASMAQYTGVEPDRTSFEIARRRIEPLGVVLNGDHRCVPDGSAFDVVCAFEVLEHVEDDRDEMAAWAKLVAPGGGLVLSVPAWPARYGPHDEQAGHLRRYTPDQVRGLLTDVGLSDIQLDLIGWPIGGALESARNAVARARRTRTAAQSHQERTAASARFLHLQGGVGARATATIARPFMSLQRLRPASGVCIVASARA